MMFCEYIVDSICSWNWLVYSFYYISSFELFYCLWYYDIRDEK